MPAPNYRQQKRQKELARQSRKAEKQSRKARQESPEGAVAADGSPQPAPAGSPTS